MTLLPAKDLLDSGCFVDVLIICSQAASFLPKLVLNSGKGSNLMRTSSHEPCQLVLLSHLRFGAYGKIWWLMDIFGLFVSDFCQSSDSSILSHCASGSAATPGVDEDTVLVRMPMDGTAATVHATG